MNDGLEMHLYIQKLKSCLEGALKIHIEDITNDFHVIRSDFKLQKSYKGAVTLQSETGHNDSLDLPPQQLKNLVRGIVWRDEHFNGVSMKEIAIREGLSKAGVQRIVVNSIDRLMTL